MGLFIAGACPVIKCYYYFN